MKPSIKRMPLTVSWQPNIAARQVLEALAAGKCVVLPTESTYEIVAPALNEYAVHRLEQRTASRSLALTHVAEVADWLPRLAGAGARLVRKLGSGPYTLVVDAGYRSGLFGRLPSFAQESLRSENGISIRMPDHPIWAELVAFGQPLISVPIAGAVNATEAARLVGDHAALVVDAGNLPSAITPSLVQADGRRVKLLCEGVLTQEQLDEVTLCRVLFVCTGNTCRSPMAEALCVKLLADRLGCAPADLKRHGFCVQSAGLAAMMGSEASSEAVNVVAGMGADLSRHRSCMATVDMLLWADHVFAMTTSHWHTLLSVDVPNLVLPQMLSPHHADIADPIGRPLIDYQTCAQQILDCLNQRLPQILES